MASTPPIANVLKLAWNKKIVGFLQLPLSQEYLYGGMYIVRKKAFQNKLKELGLNSLPRGLVAEDAFFDHILAEKELFISKSLTFYEPSDINDYFKYLARIRWQNQQINLFFNSTPKKKHTLITRLIRKLMSVKSAVFIHLRSSYSFEDDFYIYFSKKN